MSSTKAADMSTQAVSPELIWGRAAVDTDDSPVMGAGCASPTLTTIIETNNALTITCHMRIIVTDSSCVHICREWPCPVRPSRCLVAPGDNRHGSKGVDQTCEALMRAKPLTYMHCGVETP